MKSSEEKEIRRVFWENFASAAERILGIGRYERGFMRAIKESLDLPTYSVPQRWIEGFMPRLPHLVRIYRKWGVTPNELLGIETPQKDRETSTKLHTLFSAMDHRKKKGEKTYRN